MLQGGAAVAALTTLTATVSPRETYTGPRPLPETDTPTPGTHGPLLAHVRGYTDGVALCGARIMGIPAPEGYRHICVSCLWLDEQEEALWGIEP